MSLSLFHHSPNLTADTGRAAHGPSPEPRSWQPSQESCLVPEAPDAPAGKGASRCYTSPSGAEAEELNLAYLRYIELHGHALHDPKGDCSITRRKSGCSETQTFGFWSQRAAREFEWFWERYRLVYGHPPGRDGLAAA